jgi:NADPH2 dehydrogenase
MGLEKMPVPKLLDPLTVGGLSLKNRIVMPQMANDLGTAQGEVTQPLIAHYTRRAAGVGLVIVEHSYIAKGDKLSSRQLGTYDDGGRFHQHD